MPHLASVTLDGKQKITQTFHGSDFASAPGLSRWDDMGQTEKFTSKLLGENQMDSHCHLVALTFLK